MTNNKTEQPRHRDVDWQGAALMIALIVTFNLILLGLFLADYVLAPEEHTPLLTEAIIHTILGGVMVWIGMIVGYFFGMKQAQSQVRSDAQRNGGVQK